jgi:hypothetical protein
MLWGLRGDEVKIHMATTVRFPRRVVSCEHHHCLPLPAEHSTVSTFYMYVVFSIHRRDGTKILPNRKGFACSAGGGGGWTTMRRSEQIE